MFSGVFENFCKIVTAAFSDIAKSGSLTEQWRIYGPAQHLQWNLFAGIFTGFSVNYFREDARSQMFDRVAFTAFFFLY